MTGRESTAPSTGGGVPGLEGATAIADQNPAGIRETITGLADGFGQSQNDQLGPHDRRCSPGPDRRDRAGLRCVRCQSGSSASSSEPMAVHAKSHRLFEKSSRQRSQDPKLDCVRSGAGLVIPKPAVVSVWSDLRRRAPDSLRRGLVRRGRRASSAHVRTRRRCGIRACSGTTARRASGPAGFRPGERHSP